MSFLQNEQEDDDGDFGAPMAAICKSGTINLLTNLWTEAQAQLDVAQKIETHAAHSFALLKQSLGVGKSAASETLDEANAER